MSDAGQADDRRGRPLTVVIAAGAFTDLERERERLGPAVELREADLGTPEAARESTSDADAIVVTVHRLDEQIIAALGSAVRVIGRAGVGLDNVDMVAAEQRKIAVVYQPDYATNEVATHAVAMLLALNRKLSDGDAIARHDWPSRKSRLAGLVALEALTIGVVGCGHIGRAVIDRLRPFGARILAFDALAVDVPAGVERVSNFDVLLQRCDVLTLHLPLTATTSCLIDARALGQLRNGALLVNVARGGLIDETAVAAALASGALGGYAADTFVHEPFRADGPLASAPNTLFSPHIAWLSQTSVVRLRTWTLDGVLQFLRTSSVTTGRIAGTTTANTVGQSNAGLDEAEPGCV